MIALIAAHIQGSNKAPEQMMLQLSKFLHLSAAFEYRVKLFISLFADKRNLFGLCIFFLAYPVQLTPFRELYCQAPAAFQPDLLSLRCNSKIIANQFFFVCESQKLLDNTKPKGNRTDNNKKNSTQDTQLTRKQLPKRRRTKKKHRRQPLAACIICCEFSKDLLQFCSKFQGQLPNKKRKGKKKLWRKNISKGSVSVSVGWQFQLVTFCGICVCVCACVSKFSCASLTFSLFAYSLFSAVIAIDAFCCCDYHLVLLLLLLFQDFCVAEVLVCTQKPLVSVSHRLLTIFKCLQIALRMFL